MTGSMSEAQSLKSFYDRIWNLLDERDGLQSDIRDVFDEAKDAGIVPKVLRKIITRHRAKDQAKLQREESLQADYEATLDSKTKAVLAELRAGTTFDATAKKTGVPRRTVARLAEAVPETSQSGTATPHDPETGEVHGTQAEEGHAEGAGQEGPVSGQPDAGDAGEDAAGDGGRGNGQDHVREDGDRVCPAGEAQGQLSVNALAAMEESFQMRQYKRQKRGASGAQ